MALSYANLKTKLKDNHLRILIKTSLSIMCLDRKIKATLTKVADGIKHVGKTLISLVNRYFRANKLHGRFNDSTLKNANQEQ